MGDETDRSTGLNGKTAGGNDSHCGFFIVHDRGIKLDWRLDRLSKFSEPPLF